MNKGGKLKTNLQGKSRKKGNIDTTDTISTKNIVEPDIRKKVSSDKEGKNITDNTVRFNAMKWDIPTSGNVVIRRANQKAVKPPYHPYNLPMTKGERIIEFNPKDENKININIETWADVDAKTYQCWGDYWVKEKLGAALQKLGAQYNVAPQDADVTIYLWGSPFPQRHNFPYMYNPATHNIMWFYSHPQKMTQNEIIRYDTVFCLSHNYIKILNQKGWHQNLIQEPLISCSNFKPPKEKLNREIDVLFVGNSRGGLQYGRKAIWWLSQPEDVKIEIYGHKWYRQPEYAKWFVQMYWNYNRLNELYNTAKITLIDGHEPMNEHGFVQMKIFDVLASGGFPLSYYNAGMKQIFGDLIPQYKTKTQMNALIRYFLKHEDERLEVIKESKKYLKKHTYKHRAQTIFDYIRKEVIKNDET
jgi:hypothetical protein